MKEHNPNQRQLVASVSLKQEKGYLSVINLSDILKELFSLYYKEYLYRSIIAELQHKTDPENIVCFEWSLIPDQFMQNKLVTRFEDIPMDENTIQFFYLLGAPHGLLPGKQTEDLCEIFNVYNSLFPSKRRSNMDDGWMLREAYRYYKEKGVSGAVFSMIQEAKRKSDGHAQRLKNIDQITKRYNDWYKMIWEKNIFESRRNTLHSGKTGRNDLIKDKLYDSYYASAFRCLTKNKFPAVAIFNPKNQSMRFLAKEILGDSNNPYFFDLKSYTHKSPGVMEILAEANTWLPVIGSLFTIGGSVYAMHKAYTNYKAEKAQPSFEDMITYDKDISTEEKQALRHYYMGIEEGKHMDFLINIIENEFCKKELKKSYEVLFENSKDMLKSFNLVINSDRKIKVSVKKENEEK